MWSISPGDPSPPTCISVHRRIAEPFTQLHKESLVLNVGNPLTSWFAKVKDPPPCLIVICAHQVDLCMLESFSVNKSNKTSQLVSLFMVANSRGEVCAKMASKGCLRR